ncbi:MAG: hypothetical protein QOE87_1035 [Gaiellales bacterium]|jgi:hypothetical protein|nr:hypothetical protein [Gaiellales bacterium]
MAVAIEMIFRGGTLAQYDEVMRMLDLGDTPPEGALFHWVAATDDGIKVVDVWETIEQFNRFAGENIMPSAQKAGFDGPPETTTHEVHNHLGGADSA